MRKSLTAILAAAAMMFVCVLASGQEYNFGFGGVGTASRVPGEEKRTPPPSPYNFAFGFGPASRIHHQGEEESATYGFQVSLESCKRSTRYFGYSAGMDFGTYRKQAFYLSSAPISGGDKTEMYLDFPVRIRIYLPFSQKYQAYFFGGLVPSLCLGSHYMSPSESTYQSDFGEDRNGSRVDLLAGGGTGLEINGQVRFSVSYDFGILNRQKAEAEAVATGEVRKLLVDAIKINMLYFF